MKSGLLSAAMLMAAANSYAAGDVAYQVQGQGWMDIGRIMGAADTLSYPTRPGNTIKLQGNGLQSLGAQLTLTAGFTGNLEAAFGFGVQKANHALGDGANAFLAISLFQEYLTQSRLTWYQGERAAPSLSLTLGNFPYKYHPDVKNLGLYLLRGPVYPGILMGGFGDFAADTSKSTLLGLRAHQSAGNFSQDLLLNNEREVPPTLDWSLAYVARYRAFGALEMGAGVNFYRLIPYDSRLETPGHFSDATLAFRKADYIETDSGSTDTVFFTHQGTKLMAMFSLDLKPLFGIGAEGSDDWKLYGEAAVLGVRDYGKAYGDMARRIPVMAGFNFPGFGFVDHASLEVEYYGALYRNDLVRVGNNNVVADWTRQAHPIPSPKPPAAADYGIDAQGNWVNRSGDTVNVNGTAQDMGHLTADDWKWSFYADKTVSEHISFIGQIANDHYRPRPIATGLINSEGGTAEAFASPRDWYFMLRIGYFF